MAAKLARLVYRMLRYGMKYVDQGAAVYDLRHRELQIKRLKAKAEKLGYRITPNTGRGLTSRSFWRGISPC